MGPNPRCNHSLGETFSGISHDSLVEKTRSFWSEKAQMAGSGAEILVMARSSLPEGK